VSKLSDLQSQSQYHSFCDSSERTAKGSSRLVERILTAGSFGENLVEGVEKWVAGCFSDTACRIIAKLH